MCLLQMIMNDMFTFNCMEKMLFTPSKQICIELTVNEICCEGLGNFLINWFNAVSENYAENYIVAN